MKAIFIQYKPFFSFLSKFLLFYIVFTFVYNYFLNQFDASKNEVDNITMIVAKQTKTLLHFFGAKADIKQSDVEPAVQLIYNGRFVLRIIEGCSGVSVMILFAAFIFAFSVKMKRTVLYIFLGVLIIYILNIIRIALIAYALYYFPKYNDFLHEVLFPVFIYGVVFLLWVLWVTKFSGYDRKVR